MTTLEKKAPDLVHQRGAVPDKLVANAVQRLHVELLLGLEFNKVRIPTIPRRDTDMITRIVPI